MEPREELQSGEGETKRDDSTFLNLLSSQRRLLSEISSGVQSTSSKSSQKRPYGARLSGDLVHNRMNQPISYSTSNELPYSKSSSTGTDRFGDVGPDPSFTFSSFESKASELIVDGDAKLPAKRTPSLGLGHSLSFLESSDQSRRGSGSSNRRNNEEEGLGIEDKNDDEHEDEDDDDLSSIEPLDYKYDFQPTLLINELVALDQAMARSQESQLAIHNWDKQMGLKRSHSKTMRLSSRSRKKIRSFLKREIAAISQPQQPPKGVQV